MQQEVLTAYRNADSPTVRQQILEEYAELVEGAIPDHDCHVDGVDRAALMRIGYQALALAFQEFEPSGECFEDYARTQISNHIQRYLQQRRKSSGIKEITSDLFLEYQSQPSIELRNRLVELNIGLVRKEAHHWVNQCSETLDDLIQVGTIGLIRAIERFESGKGFAFSSFAIPYIRGEIQHYLRDKSPTLKMPRSLLALHQQAGTIMRKYRSQHGKDPSETELVQMLGVSMAEWQEVKLACQNRTPISLDSQINDNDDQSVSLGELITDQRYRSFQLAQEDSLRLQQALDQLEDRTREIVEFVFLKEFTYKEAAEALGVSVVTVSRRLKKGLELLKKIMTTLID
jgi:RNA polymerase sigma-B factor